MMKPAWPSPKLEVETAPAGRGGLGGGHQITVVITTRDRASRLRQAIESVLRSPLITTPEQIIVVDDDSSDGTEEVVRQFGVGYARIARHNVSDSRNAGLALTQTPYIAFLDDDDIWLPGNMEAHLAALETHPDAAFAYGIAQCATPDLEPLPFCFPTAPLPSGLVPNELHRSGYPQLGVVLFRQDAVASVAGCDPNIRYGQDGDLMLRIAGRHEIIGVEVVGMLHRLRPASKARSDYHWARARRKLLRWRPRGVGVSWRTAATYRIETRGLFFWHFHEDAVACIGLGQCQDGLVCLGRALWISPLHSLRHARQLGATFWRCVQEAQRLQPWRKAAAAR